MGDRAEHVNVRRVGRSRKSAYYVGRQWCTNGLLWPWFVTSRSAIRVPSVEDTRPELSENMVGLMESSVEHSKHQQSRFEMDDM